MSFSWVSVSQWMMWMMIRKSHRWVVFLRTAERRTKSAEAQDFNVAVGGQRQRFGVEADPCDVRHSQVLLTQHRFRPSCWDTVSPETLRVSLLTTVTRKKTQQHGSVKWQWKCVECGGRAREERAKEGDERVQDGLSRDRLTEVMRREDERGESDSGIQIRGRLTLLECVSLSKCPYSIFTEHTHTHDPLFV